MLDLIQTIFWAIVAIGLLVGVHEFGHFWVARRLGVQVLRFSIGFGKSLWTVRGRDGVEYVVAAIPLGGYVKMLDEREAPVAPDLAARAFNRQPLSVRSAIVLAGPLANFLFAILAYWLLFVGGETVLKPVLDTPPPQSVAAEAGFRAGDEILRVGSSPVQGWESVLMAFVRHAVDGRSAEVLVLRQEGYEQELQIAGTDLLRLTSEQDGLRALGFVQHLPAMPAVIASVNAGGAADRAGFLPGDEILAVDGRAIDSWQDWSAQIRQNPGRTLMVRLHRNGQVIDLQLIPAERQDGTGLIGFAGVGTSSPAELFAALQVEVHRGPLQALGRSLSETWNMSALTLKVIGGMLSGRMPVESIGGPLTIAKTAGDTADASLGIFLKFLAMLSVTIAVLNLLPIPVLDGGHLAFYLVEAIKGSPLSEAVQAKAQTLGMMLLFGIMFLALYVDFGRFFG